MKAVRADYPATWPYVNLYTLADLHVGDPHSLHAEVMRRIRQAENDPYGLVILNGDIMNTAVRNGVSDVYGEIMTPMQQIECMVDMFRPISGKIIGVTTGNHENRIYKNDGIDTTRLVCRELGIKDRYAPEGILIFLRFGKRNGHSCHRDKNPMQWYSIYATHGSGGGRKEGAKAIRLADMAAIVDADVYVHSHTHLPMVMKQAFYRTSPGNCSIAKVSKLFVNTGASMDYGGYGQSQEYKPASHDTPVIHLEAEHKRMSATL